ncbi:MAG: hypothetical protein QF473_03640 [Planctomycetota bacterium]|nr:hypothetical protein [Planctomycetota bacterium]
MKKLPILIAILSCFTLQRPSAEIQEGRGLNVLSKTGTVKDEIEFAAAIADPRRKIVFCTRPFVLTKKHDFGGKHLVLWPEVLDFSGGGTLKGNGSISRIAGKADYAVFVGATVGLWEYYSGSVTWNGTKYAPLPGQGRRPASKEVGIRTFVMPPSGSNGTTAKRMTLLKPRRILCPARLTDSPTGGGRSSSRRVDIKSPDPSTSPPAARSPAPVARELKVVTAWAKPSSLRPKGSDLRRSIRPATPARFPAVGGYGISLRITWSSSFRRTETISDAWMPDAEGATARACSIRV